MVKDKSYLRVAGYPFDPLREEPDLPPDLRIEEPPEQPAYYIIQFHESLTREEQEWLKDEYGLQLSDYVPRHAYLEKVDAKQLAALAREPEYRASVLYHPAFKISPSIGKIPFRTEERREMDGLWLTARLFDEADASQVPALLKRGNARRIRVLDDRELGGPVRARFIVPDMEDVKRVAHIDSVRWIEEVPEAIEDNVNAAGTNQSGTAGNEPVWDQGLHGEGQIIGILDSAPLDIDHCFFEDPADNTLGPSHRKVLDIRNASGDDPGGHATFVAGCAAGDDFNNPGTANRRGGAWAARLVSGNRSDLSSTSLLSELSAAASMGATVHSNSWHDNTAGAGNPATYNQNAADVDSFTWNNEDHLVLGSAGNTGEEQGPPGTSKNAICVGAAQADPNEMNLGDGNVGPTDDGRRKPDLVAVGCNIQSATVDTACNTGPRSACATSYATPHTAALAALARQYYTEGWYPTGTRQPYHAFTPSGALLKATLINACVDMTGVAGYPSNMEGWGLVRLDDVLHFSGDARNLRVWDVRNADGLTTGDTREHHVDVASNTQALRVVLVWTEPPSTDGADEPVVNDLDLEVVSPDGTQTFRGNVFAAGFSTTGGAADGLNNVEVVLVNAPAPGDWTIRVIGSEVNVGSPGQGYAVVTTADLTEPPVSTGVQDTLVVRVQFADVVFEPPLPNLQNMMEDVATYFDEISYGQVEVVPLFRGPIALDHPKNYYYHPERSLLIELTEEVVAKLVAAEPDIFDAGTGDPADDIDRMIIVTNDVNFTEDWATTGPWPYSLPGGLTRPISVSVQSYANGLGRFTHGLAHHFGLVDLYAHPGVIFPRPYVDEWDNMAGLFTNVHPLVWSKELAGWITGHGSTIEYIPRPAAGGSYAGPNPIPLFLQESTDANRKAIALGLTEGAASLEDENAFYYVEARSNTLGGFDDGLPDSGVLIYYVNELIPQGEGPVILRDRVLSTMTLADAVFNVGHSTTIPGTGITLTVQAGSGGAAFDIQIDYTPPVTDYNVRITRGDTIDGTFYSYFSPDIWVDSPKNGFDLGGGPPPHEERQNPVIGEVNRIYARITNDGPATAFDFDVRFRISDPYHTVGGEADFDEFVGIEHVDSLAPGSTNVYVEWTPTAEADPHTCVLVDLINLVGTDTNPNDNEAQENLRKVTSVTESPYHAVTYRYDLTNPYDRPALFYFRAEGAPPDWDVTLTPRKILLDPGEHMLGYATVKPPEDAKVCTSERIQVTSWTPRGDTLIPVGGGVVQVDLRRPTAFEVDVGARRCEDNDLKRLYEETKEKGEEFDFERIRRLCGRVIVEGCTDPPMPNQEIIVKFVSPSGEPVYHTVKTDENGCFEDFLVVVDPGIWEVTIEYEGDECQAPEVDGPRSVCWCP